MNSQKRLVKRLLDNYRDDRAVLGVIQVGSTVKGYNDKHSDVDFEIVVTEDRFDELARNCQKIIHTRKYDLIFTTTSRIQQIKNSDKDEDRWDYQDSIVLLDKTGKIQQALAEIARYDEASRLGRLKRYYRSFWENILDSWSCLEHQNASGARIYAAFAVQALIQLLFNFNHRWAPRLQWAFKEITTLPKKPVSLKTQLKKVLEQPGRSELSKLWNQTTDLLREEQYSWIDHPEELL